MNSLSLKDQQKTLKCDRLFHFHCTINILLTFGSWFVGTFKVANPTLYLTLQSVSYFNSNFYHRCVVARHKTKIILSYYLQKPVVIINFIWLITQAISYMWSHSILNAISYNLLARTWLIKDAYIVANIFVKFQVLAKEIVKSLGSINAHRKRVLTHKIL